MRDESLVEGRLLLSDWLVILTSHYNHETGVARFDPEDTSPVDGAFTSCVPLQAMPRLVGRCRLTPGFHSSPRACFQALIPKYDKLLSNSAFNCNMRQYSLVFALLRSPMLRPAGVSPDARTHMQLLAGPGRPHSSTFDLNRSTFRG